MSEEINLVADLAVILIAAGVFTVISKALKQPLILGYIVAGFIISPNLGLLPAISGTGAVKEWSELGIVFLLFALGLEFSFKKLLKVGSSALITAGTQCIGMFIAGIIGGSALGWSMMESIFLGGLLSISSTSIIIKAYDELGMKNRPWSGLLFGSLVVQDLIAVLLMVLLSTLAVSNKFAGGEMVMSLARLAFFLILWFLTGLYVIPILLKKARKYLNDEILLIISIGLCFMMVALASFAGFSSALGAFVMGSILAETVEGERIERLLHSIKDLFAAIFFVSVGMMLDPSVIGSYWGTILVVTIIAMAGMLVFSTSGALLAGKGLETAVHVGFSLAQIGEFSFIIASLGVSLGVMRDFIYPVVITVSVITTFTTPYMIKAADPVYAWLLRKLPAPLLARINPPQDEKSKGSKAESSAWTSLLKSYATRVTLYGVILVAILIASRTILHPFATKMFSFSESLVSGICLGVTLLVMAPFLYGFAVTNGSINKYASKLLKENAAARWPLLSLMVLRILVALGFVIAAITSYFSLGGWGILTVLLTGLALFIIAKFTMQRLSGLEKRFIENFNERENLARKRTPVSSSVKEMMADYDIHTEIVTITSDYDFIGKSLKELPFRSGSGVNIIKIIRGSRNITIPSGREAVYPGDRLVAVGTTAQLEAFKDILIAHKLTPVQGNAGAEEDFAVIPVTLAPDSYLTGKTLSETDMRHGGCMVISVLHNGRLVANPRSDYRFAEGDTVWLAGEAESCKWYI